MRSSAEVFIPVPSEDERRRNADGSSPHPEHIVVEDGGDEVRHIRLNVIPRHPEKIDHETEAGMEEPENEPRRPSSFSGKLSVLLNRDAKLIHYTKGDGHHHKEAEARPEEKISALESARNNYAEMERRASAAIQKLARERPGGENRQWVRNFETAMSSHKFIAQDREWLSGEGELAADAMKRRDAFISNLKSFGLAEDEALACYAQEVARMEYEVKKSGMKRELGTRESVLGDFEEKFGRPRGEWSPQQVIEAMDGMRSETNTDVLQFLLKEQGLLNEARTEKRPARLRGMIEKCLPVFLKGSPAEKEQAPKMTFEAYREKFLTACGFEDRNSFEAIGRLKISIILGQTDRTISTYPAAWRALIEHFEVLPAFRRMTVAEALQEEYKNTEHFIESESEREGQETPESAAPEAALGTREERPRPEAPIRPGFSETLITAQSLGRALEKQLTAHMGTRFTDLPAGSQEQVVGYLTEMIADGKGVKLDLTRLVPGEKVNFAPLFEDKDILDAAFEFPDEADRLSLLRFENDEILDESYVRVIRNMPIGKYLDAFREAMRKGLYAEYGLRKTLEQDGAVASFYVDEGHVELARLIEKAGLTSDSREMSVAEFLKRHGREAMAT